MSQNGNQTQKIHKIDDRTAFELMSEIKEFLGVSDPIRISIVQGIEFTENDFPVESLEIGKYRVSILRLSGRANSFGSNLSFTAEFSRVNPHNIEGIDPYFDFVKLTFSSQTGEWSTKVDPMLRCVEIITSRDISVIPENTDNTELLRSIMVSQGAAHQRMLDELNKSIIEIASRRAELEEDFARREAERSQLNAETQSQLEQEKLALERQSYMATRRKLGQSIHKIMTGIDGEVEKNKSYRSFVSSAIFLAYLMLGTSGAIATFFTLSAFASSTLEQQSMDAFRWFLVVKLTLSSIVTVFGFVAAATWMRKHLDNETRLSEEKLAFIADIERASWVIEAIHEVKNEAQGELPKEWVEAVTRNLFSPRTAAADLDDGAQALRALIGLAGSAKVGPQGLEMEFNKKGTKALGEG